VLLERDRIVGAALAGALASATRPVGLVVAVALVIRLAERRSEGPAPRARVWARLDPRRLHGHDRLIFASFAGWLSFAGYLAVRFGDPFAFASVQGAPGWDQAVGPTTWGKVAFLAAVKREWTDPGSLGLVAQAALSVAALASVPIVRRRFGDAYALYVALIVAVPMASSKDFQGMGRYLLGAFPVAAVLAERLAARPRALALVVVCGVPALMLFVSWFAKGNYLA
jgi:hypothetical protein